MPFNSRNLLSASGLHFLLFLVLVLGVRCTPQMQPPPVIEALVITGENKEGKLKTEPPPPPPPPEPEPPTPEPPTPEPPPPPPPEPPKPEPPKPDPEIERKKLEAEKRKREIELKRQAEIQRKKEEEEKKKKEAEQKKREEEQKRLEEERKRKEEERKRLEEERRKKEEEERKRKEEEQRRLKEEFERSIREEAEARAEAARIGEVQKTWAQQLSDHIRRRWLRPPGLPPRLSCQVEIEILPNGEVISVKILRSSGNPSFDHSVENAVYKSSPLPLPDDPKAFQRVLKPVFTPESLGG